MGSAISGRREDPPGEALKGCFTTLYNTSAGAREGGKSMHMKLKQTGSVSSVFATGT